MGIGGLAVQEGIVKVDMETLLGYNQRAMLHHGGNPISQDEPDCSMLACLGLAGS